MNQKLLVVAIGGHALLEPKQKGTTEEQRINAQKTCHALSCLFRPKYSLIFTHGNGPQVGNILVQNELGVREAPALSLDACVAESEGSMGYFLQQGMLNALRAKRIRRYVVTVVTQVLVNRNDSAFKNPTKPVGFFYSKAKAARLMSERGWHMVRQGVGGWRRVVPSPKPVKVIQRYMIRDSAHAGHIVIAAGGGGVPIIQRVDGSYAGVEAVIDKDLSSAVLASDIKADFFIILTTVAQACLHFQKPEERPLRQVSAAQAAAYLRAGHFAQGSMKPKIEAALLYLNRGGRRVIITDIVHLKGALAGRAGTLIYASRGL